MTLPLEGFTAVEVAPLSATQVRDIASRWLPQPEEFLEALAALPYRDVADRPLLLRQLLLLYKRYGFLPEQPAQVYKRVIRLLLEEWDAQRHVVRTALIHLLTNHAARILHRNLALGLRDGDDASDDREQQDNQQQTSA